MLTSILLFGLLGADARRDLPQVWLGASMEAAEGCAKIVALVPNGPAARAGLERGDCVRRVGASATTGPHDMLEALRELGTATEVELVTATGSKVVALERRPPDAERQLCQAMAAVRTRVIVQRPDGSETELVLPPKATLQELRSATAMTARFTVLALRPDCEHLLEPISVIKNAEPTLQLTEGTRVRFLDSASNGKNLVPAK
ncbi:MAG TPA: PDZ domain-containing protein [Archangium sp.]